MVPDGQSCRAKSSCYLQNSHGAGSGTVHFSPLSLSTISLISRSRGYPRTCASSKRTASGPPIGVVALEMLRTPTPPQTFPQGLLGISLLAASSSFWFPTGGGNVFEQLLHKASLTYISHSSNCGCNKPFRISSNSINSNSLFSYMCMRRWSSSEELAISVLV